MKKLLAIALVLILCFALSACGGSDERPDTSENTARRDPGGKAVENYDFFFSVPPEESGGDEEPEPTLAYLHFFEYLPDGSARFFVDKVLWIDDNDAPNGYRIENEGEGQFLCTAGWTTECYLWRYDPQSETGMVLREYDNFPEFLDEVRDGWRRGTLLAKISCEGEYLSIIREEYTP